MNQQADVNRRPATATDPFRDPAAGVGFTRLWGAALVAAVAAAPFVERLAGYVPSCPLKAMSGVPCPFCGTTRSAELLAHGHVLEAFATYPLATLLWTAFLVGGFVALILALRGRPLPAWRDRWSIPTLSIGMLLVAAGWFFNIATGV